MLRSVLMVVATVFVAISTFAATTHGEQWNWEKVFDDACEFTEGPALAPDGRIFFSDITFSSKCRDENGQMNGRVWAYDPKTNRAEIIRHASGQSNGLFFGPDGALYAAEGAANGGRRVSRLDPATGAYRVVADRYNGRAFNSPNDLVIDSKGRIYFTDPRYVGDEPLDLPVMGVYRVDGYNRVKRVINHLTRPNGIVLSPDEKTLYVAMADNGGINWLDMSAPPLDTWGQGGIMAYDVLANGDVDNPRVFVDLEKHGGVDGMTVDRAGNVYAAVVSHARPGVYVYSPQGKRLKIIDSPNKAHPTNVVFGADGKTLYLTVGGKDLYRIRLD